MVPMPVEKISNSDEPNFHLAHDNAHLLQQLTCSTKDSTQRAQGNGRTMPYRTQYLLA
uniref:Uncharacterized protein n=1 Tax=Arundo donax TaxID=35708 RepID=A0A0A9H731_ARUDO